MSEINFMAEIGDVSNAYMEFVKTVASESALEEKTHHLAYLSVMTAKEMISGVDWHVQSLIRLGATRDEVKSAILVAMPVMGMKVKPVLIAALESYDKHAK